MNSIITPYTTYIIPDQCDTSQLVFCKSQLGNMSIEAERSWWQNLYECEWTDFECWSPTPNALRNSYVFIGPISGFPVTDLGPCVHGQLWDLNVALFFHFSILVLRRVASTQCLISSCLLTQDINALWASAFGMVYWNFSFVYPFLWLNDYLYISIYIYIEFIHTIHIIM